ADPDPWRDVLRVRLGQRDLAALRALADDAKALEVQPTESLLLLANGLRGLNDRARADKVLRRAWARDPGDFWTNVNLGESQWSGHGHDRPAEALRYDTAALVLHPRSPAVHNNVGMGLIELGRLDEAAAEFRAALRLSPDSVEAHYNLGCVYS